MRRRSTWLTAFLVLPLTLHGPTRRALPRRANTAFAGWVAEHAALVAELPGRARRLRPVSREAMLFAVGHHVLSLEGGGFVPGVRPVRPKAKPAVTTGEVKEVRSAAGLLGRWFAGQRTQSVILQGLGIVP